MKIEFDPVKSAKNERERGLPFAEAAPLFDGPRLEWEDRRKDYGEVRINTLGEIEGRIFFATFTRRGEAARIISFRKANTREARLYRQHLSK
ncbi:MAG: BrnT family toxin [Rhizomicrobium sp.]|jgi:uncharacterized DUF497 family protein